MSIEVNADGARIQTEAKLHEMEVRLGGIYRRAGAEIEQKAAAWFERYEKADAKKRAAVESGKITAEEYARWRKNKMLYSKRFLAFRDKTSAEISAVNRKALDYINGEMPEVYMININGIGTDIAAAVNESAETGISEFAPMAGISFDLVDADTVRLLSIEDQTLLPHKNIDVPVDERWNMQAVQGEVLQGILQGENIPTIAKRLSRVTDMNRKTAVRNARTMVTGAENRGRLDGMRRAKDMGILLEREWMDAGDKRVRDLHAMLDGQIRSVDEPFEVEGYLIMYPGDPSARPELVYNCRCTTRAVVSGFRNPVTGKVEMVDYSDDKSYGFGTPLFTNNKKSGIITGARITDPESERGIEFAEIFYIEIRLHTGDVKSIAEKTGKSKEDIQKIKDYLFVDKSLYDEDLGEWRRFDPDCAIAHSWQRLMDGKNIQTHDLTLIEHELFEMKLKSADPAISHAEAHAIATEKFNYIKESMDYYDRLKEHHKNR